MVDGTDRIVQESSTKDPLHPVSDSTFLPLAPFPSPLNETWADTRGADLVWSPVSFEHSFQMAYTRTHYGTGYYIYDQFVRGTALTHPIHSWNESVVPGQDVLDLIAKSGTDISPPDARESSGKVNVPASGAVTTVELKGKGTIRLLSFSIPREQAAAFKDVRLQVTWDGRPQPSIDVHCSLLWSRHAL